jgi:MFS family permease
MILGSILNPVNSSIIAVSLVPIGRAFGAPPSQTAWLVSALYVATAIGQPVVGRLVDTFGPRRLFLIGTTLVGVAGILGTVAPSLPALVGARVLLGFGTCAGYPAAMYLIRSEARRTGRDSPAGVLTALAVATQTVAVIGPSLGGLLIGLGGWRATFAINIPLSIAGLVLGSLRLPKAPAREPGARQTDSLDLPGIVMFASMLVSLLFFLTSPQAGRWYLLVVSAVGAAGFAARELRVETPFIDLRVLAGNVPLLLTYIRMLLASVISYAFVYGYTQWLEDGRGLSASETGIILLPMFGAAVLVSTTTGRRKEVHAKLLVGAVAQIVGCSLLLLLHAGSSTWLLVAIAITVGIPQGLNSLANQNALYYQADPARMGSSAGLLRTFSYLGAITASAANGVFFKHTADTRGLHHLAVFVVVVALLFFVVTVADRSLRRLGRPDDPAAEKLAPEILDVLEKTS